MGDGHFRPPGAPKPLNRFTWNMACVITSTVRQHMQNMVAVENGGGGLGIWVKLHPRVLFYNRYWSCVLTAVTASTRSPCQTHTVCILQQHCTQQLWLSANTALVSHRPQIDVEKPAAGAHPPVRLRGWLCLYISALWNSILITARRYA